MKILITKEKSVEADGRRVVIQKPRTYFVDSAQDFHCMEGIVTKDQFDKSIVTTDRGVEFSCFDATFYDTLHRIERGVQLITPKDGGAIIACTGLTKDSVVIEGGSGSGGLTCFLAALVKHVYSYDLNAENSERAKRNATSLGFENVTFHVQDMAEKIHETNADAIVLDMPEPWSALENAVKAVKPGGFVIGYVPSTTQVEAFGNALAARDDVVLLRTIESVQRSWKVKGRAVRPISGDIGHTAFLMFARRLH